jgi:predicted small lipoprotein YifL
MSSRLPSARLVLVSGAVALSLAACGRRGAPEAPPDASVQQGNQAEPGTSQAGTLPSPVGTPKRSGRQGYVIPNQPFILDPLL